ncbi:MAG: response regulator [Leptolyngbya sp. SIO1E4]|nr:response regulator [Leptolyngbya sp. SIO1E4]
MSNQLGALSAGAYADYTSYQPVNTPDQINDPNHWQPLRIVDGHTTSMKQLFIAPHWGLVMPFALKHRDQFQPNEYSVQRYPSKGYERQAQDVLDYGLGLAISKRLVKLMGGDIQVRSQLHQGSTFSITIPVLPITPPISTDSPASAQVDIELRSEQLPYRILVVDDVLVNRLLLTKIFDSPSFAVKETQNGKEAIEVWQNWHPDLVLMDIQMPVMDGYAATRWIKQQSQKTVVIAITANAFKEERQAILKAGCDDFISKPFQRDEVLAKVIQHLETNYIENSKSSI